MARRPSATSRLRIALLILGPASLCPPLEAQLPAQAVGTGASATARDTAYGALEETLGRLGIPGAHRLGLTGAGIRIGILDGTFLLDHEAFRQTAIIATRDLVDADGDVTPGPTDPADWAARGTAVLSLVGATDSDVLLAPAFGAAFALARTVQDDGAPRADETRWLEGLEWLESQGARVVVSGGTFRSFDDAAGYTPEDLDGITALSTVAAAEAAARGVLVVSPTGDLGPGDTTLAAPSDGVDVLAVGAVGPTGTLTGFTGRGPTADGRSKPDALAPGVDVPAADVASRIALATVTGTAAAAALVAGGVALFIEAHPERTPQAVAEALVRSASGRNQRVNGTPLMDVGSAIAFPDGIATLPVAEVDATGQVTTLTPTFEWDVPTIFPPALPVAFTILVSADTTFQQILLSERVVGTFARRLSRALPPRRTVYWRVDATTSQDIQRRTGTAGPLIVPGWVELSVLDAPGGQTISDRRPVFEWEPFEALQPPAGPLSFDLTVFNDRDEEPVSEALGLDSTTYRFADPLPVNVPLRWRIVAHDPLGGADTATSAGPFVVVSSSAPPVTVLYQNFPNPFPATDGSDEVTHIWFDLSASSAVELSVFDLRGRLVRRLIPAPGCSEVRLEAGLYGRQGGPDPDPCMRLSWDGRDDAGNGVASGVYLLRLEAAGAETVRRVVYWP